KRNILGRRGGERQRRDSHRHRDMIDIVLGKGERLGKAGLERDIVIECLGEKLLLPLALDRVEQRIVFASRLRELVPAHCQRLSHPPLRGVDSRLELRQRRVERKEEILRSFYEVGRGFSRGKRFKE